MIGFAIIFSLPRVSFFMTLVALINVVFTAIAVVTVIPMVTAAASAACKTCFLDMIFFLRGSTRYECR